MNGTATTCLLIVLTSLCASAFAGAPSRSRYLLLDSRLVSRTQNATLRVGTVAKHPANPLFVEDQPWEPRFDNLYANVLHDPNEKLYKCWYSPFIIDTACAATPHEKRQEVSYRQVQAKLRAEGKWRRVMGICYATSADGLKWTKPLMDVKPFDGKPSNLVAVGPHGSGIFRDLEEKDPQRRYKAFFKGGGMSVAFSADGLRWSDPRPCQGMDVRGDTHNNAFWAPELGRYVGITRTWGGTPRVRQVARADSEDFVTWTPAKVVLQGPPEAQTYAMPVFRYADVYLGLVMVLRPKADRVHCGLAWSPDTVAWHRIDPNTPLIGNAPKKGAYDWGCVYAAACPVFLDKEVRLYYGGSNGPHGDWRDGCLALATLRPDGFAGYEPTDRGTPAMVWTKPVVCTGTSLRITADARTGRVRVGVRAARGMELEACKPISADVTDAPVTWPAGDLAALKGKEVCLTFELTSAKLYSFRFAD